MVLGSSIGYCDVPIASHNAYVVVRRKHEITFTLEVSTGGFFRRSVYATYMYVRSVVDEHPFSDELLGGVRYQSFALGVGFS